MHNAGVSRNEGLKVSAEREEIDLLAIIEGLGSKTPVQHALTVIFSISRWSFRLHIPKQH